MRKFLSLVFLFAIFYLGCTYRVEITEYIFKNFINNELIVSYSNNQYVKDTDKYQITDNFYPQTKNDILNIAYTALNGGWDNVVFFCTSSYSNCMDDAISLIDNNDFNKINNYVHPYNSYSKITLSYNTFGKMEIIIDRLYNNEEITQLDNIVNNFINTNITDDMSDYDKIKVVHDYIINNTYYDEESANLAINNNLVNYDSTKATGVLLNGKAICGGYTDAMALFLNKLGMKNYKLTSPTHTWNYVYVNNEWKHLDVTWDDPVTNTGREMLLHTYFLINDRQLKELNILEHEY